MSSMIIFYYILAKQNFKGFDYWNDTYNKMELNLEKKNWLRI